MKIFGILTAVVLAGAASAQFYGDYKDQRPPGQTRVATKNAGIDVRVDQKLNGFVPLETTFVDEEGKTVELKKYFNGRPVVMLPIFYKCAGICETEIYSLAESLKGFKKEFVGRDFDVVVFSIDPREGPEQAAIKKDTVVASYMGPNTDKSRRVMAEQGWHFLVGSKESIDKTCGALGFRFSYDSGNGGIVHPAGLMVLTSGGKISQYFVTTEYPQRLLLDSIRAAGKDQVGALDERPFFLACVQIDPLTGQKSMNILNTLKTLGVATILVLAVSIVFWNRRHRAENGGAA